MTSVKWATAPSADDLSDANHYLTLLDYSGKWEGQPVIYYAKDLLRAARLPGLPKDNSGVKKYLDRIKSGTEISPVLLVSGDHITNVPLTIAEGYHRVSACYLLDEKTFVVCRLSL
jgi:ABC-type glycerol-3-phosphate transport system substrate-binding protein